MSELTRSVQMKQPPITQLLVSMQELQLLTGIRSRQTVYSRLRSDPAFPKPRRIGAQNIAFLRSEVEQWVQDLPVADLDGIDAVTRRVAKSRGAA